MGDQIRLTDLSAKELADRLDWLERERDCTRALLRARVKQEREQAELERMRRRERELAAV